MSTFYNSHSYSDYLSHPLVGIRCDVSPTSCKGFAGAVVLLHKKEDIIYTTLIQRGATMELCPNVIEFPGGTIDKGEDPLFGAVREVEEEIGILGRELYNVCELPSALNTTSNYWVRFWSGWLKSKPDYKVDPREVNKIIEMPLFIGQDPRYFGTTSIEGTDIPTIEFQGHSIYGTAALILSHVAGSLR